MQRTLRLIYCACAALILIDHPVVAEEFRIVDAGAANKRRGSVAELFIDGGYLHGFAPGLQTTVFSSPTGISEPREIGIFVPDSVLPYESFGKFTSKLKLLTLDSLIRDDGIISITIPELSPDQMKKIAEKAMKDKQWGLAKNYWAAFLERHPDDDKALEKSRECDSKIEYELARQLTAYEARRANNERSYRYLLALHYMKFLQLDHAREKIREIRRAHPDDYVAGQLADRIERLAALPVEGIYHPDVDPLWFEANTVPPRPLPGQPDYIKLTESFRYYSNWVKLEVLVDKDGTPLLVSAIDGSNPRAAIESLWEILLCKFSPCLYNGEPVAAFTTFTIPKEPGAEEPPANSTLIARPACPPFGHEILWVRLLHAADAYTGLLMVVNGGYADGLCDDLQGAIRAPDSTGRLQVIADVKIIDVDRYQAWCKVWLRIGADPDLLERACRVGQCLELPEPALEPDSLERLAAAAMGSADYELAAALLARLLRKQPGKTSAASVLDRCLRKLEEQELAPPDSATTAFELRYLEFYVKLMERYCAEGRIEPARNMAKRICRFHPSHAMARAYLSGLACRDSLQALDHDGGTPRTIFTPKHNVFPRLVDMSVPRHIPANEIRGGVRLRLRAEEQGRTAQTEVWSRCPNDTLNQIAVERVKNSVWYDKGERSCIVDYEYSAEGVVLVYGAAHDREPQPEGAAWPAYRWGMRQQPVIVCMPAVQLTDGGADFLSATPLTSLAPLYLNLMIDEHGVVGKVELISSSGNTAYDESVVEDLYKSRFASGTPEGRPERFWVGCVVLPPTDPAL